MSLALALGPPAPHLLSSVMDNHPDHHLGHGPVPRPHSPSSGRQMMLSSNFSQPQYPASDIPSTNKSSPAPVTTASLFPPDGASSNRRSVTENAGVHLQTSPLALNGGSSPDSHTGSAGYTWTPNNDPWSSSRSPQQPQYSAGGQRTPGGLNPAPFFQHNMHSTMANNLSPITATTPADTHHSFHSSPATTMSHLSIDQATSNGSNGSLPSFRGNSTPYPPRPTPPLSRSSSFPAPASTIPGFVPGISSMLPMSTMSSTRPGLAAPISPLGSSAGGPPHPPPGPGRLSDYSAQHHQPGQPQPPQPQHAQQQYIHNMGGPSGPMALVSHYPSGVGGAYGGHFGGMMFQPQQRTPEKPHQCDQCPTAFTRNHDLKRHKRIHWAVKPYPCDGCDKAFSRKDALKRHKMVKCCGDKGDKSKQDGSLSPTGIKSGSSSPDDSRRQMA